MKRYLLLCFAIGLVLAFASVAMTGEKPGTGIQNSFHDLCRGGRGCAYVGTGSADFPGRLCVYCHIPHEVMVPSEEVEAGFVHYPRWNQAVTTITPFQTYSNGVDTIGQPGSVSMVCLSCHDGTVASNIYGYVSPDIIGFAGAIQTAGRIGFPIDARSHQHPIGLDYHEVAKKDWDINQETSDLLGANTYGMKINDLLRNGRIECPSCHDVHNKNNEGHKLMWVEDYRSNFCLTCHKK